MTTKQFIELLILGENICASWLESGLDPELLEFAIDWDFNSSSDYFKIKKTALDLGLEPGDNNVLKLVKAGCQGTLEGEQNGYKTIRITHSPRTEYLRQMAVLRIESGRSGHEL
jgi:hypothetical protein